MSDAEIGRVDLSDVDRGIAGLVRASKDLTPVFRAARKPLRKDQREHAREAKGPQGSWPPRSPFTLDRLKRKRKSRRGRVRRILGRLPGAIDVRYDSTRIVATSQVAWSAAHQDGAVVGRGSKLPRRRFLYASDKLLKIIRLLMNAHIVKGW